MKIFSTTKIILSLIAILNSLAVQAYFVGESIPVLNYYPDCEYKVLEVATSKLETKQPLEVETKEKVLETLQHKANKSGGGSNYHFKPKY